MSRSFRQKVEVKERPASGAEAGEPKERSSSGSGTAVLVPTAEIPSAHGCESTSIYSS